MNQYLVVLSIGPVQSMIVAARRSRDLWSGSWLLSELAKSCAKSLKQQGATLIFPHIDDAQQNQLDKNSDFSVGNKIQVIIKAADTETLTATINQAKAATQERFLYESNAALSQLSYASNDIRTEIWDEQKSAYLEIQSAWAKIDTTASDGYKVAIGKASSTLAARKATRDFAPAATNPYDTAYMIPKSSLDGAYETVIAKSQNKLENTNRKKLSLADSEQLDCLGVIKRLGFDNKVEQFSPFTRITAHAWITKLIADGVNLTPIKDIYDELIKLEVATRVKGNIDNKTDKSIYADFAYDAQLLYPYRLDAAIKEWTQVDDAIGDWLKLLKKQLQPIWKDYGEPYSYGVMLLADGDRMGELLDKANSLEQHQEITKALSDFAESVADTMRDHNGHCIYAGGDDVLGFVPLDQAYDCSKKLSDNFKNQLSKVSNNLGSDKPPTLSVGLAICHIMTPMSVIRDLAKQAESHAKGDHIKHDIDKRRNALSLLLSVRSGSDIQIRYQWDDKPALDAFKQSINMYLHKDIPSRVAYDIREIHLRTNLIAHDDATLHQDIRSAELKRMLKQARTAKGEKISSETIQQLQKRGYDIGLDKLADELIVARWFAAKTQQELGKE